MRFLHTTTGQFHWFDDPSTVKYAILSHVWEKLPDGTSVEQTFQDVLRIQDRVQSERDQNLDLPSNEVFLHLCPKIRNACKYAHDGGYKYIWIDTCCINKESSAELSEAINSMYKWYADSSVCYAFLYDVPQIGEDWSGTLRKSMWFTRCWTLQELIAPKKVVFLDENWAKVGTKEEHAFHLEDITSIDSKVLLDPSSLASVSVSRRMSWASKRSATRAEDEAYSLMGIFGVNMTTIYGEGSEKAFYRLQQKILTSIPDQSIFVWDIIDSEAEDARTIHERSGTLLAPSPKSFAHSAFVVSVNATNAHDLGLATPSPIYLFTAYGIQAHLPYYRGFSLATAEDVSTERRLIPLQCIDSRSGQYLGLILRRPFNKGPERLWPPASFDGLSTTTFVVSTSAIHPSSSTARTGVDEQLRPFRRGIVRFALPMDKVFTPFFMRFPRVGMVFIAHLASQNRPQSSDSERRALADQEHGVCIVAAKSYPIAHIALMWRFPLTSRFFPPLNRVSTDSHRKPSSQDQEVSSRPDTLSSQLVKFTYIFNAVFIPFIAFWTIVISCFSDLLNAYLGGERLVIWRFIVLVLFNIGLLWDSWQFFYVFDLLGNVGVAAADAIFLPNQRMCSQPRLAAVLLLGGTAGIVLHALFLLHLTAAWPIYDK